MNIIPRGEDDTILLRAGVDFRDPEHVTDYEHRVMLIKENHDISGEWTNFPKEWFESGDNQ